MTEIEFTGEQVKKLLVSSLGFYDALPTELRGVDLEVFPKIHWLTGQRRRCTTRRRQRRRTEGQ